MQYGRSTQYWAILLGFEGERGDPFYISYSGRGEGMGEGILRS